MGEEQAALRQRSPALCWQGESVVLRVSDTLKMAVQLQSREVVFPLQACMQNQPNTQLMKMNCLQHLKHECLLTFLEFCSNLVILSEAREDRVTVS